MIKCFKRNDKLKEEKHLKRTKKKQNKKKQPNKKPPTQKQATREAEWKARAVFPRLRSTAE